LVCQDTNVLSCAGVQQGDPLGPLLFSLVLNKLILMIKEKCKNLVINSWYLDDGILVGSRRDILEAFNIFDEHGKQFGLFFF